MLQERQGFPVYSGEPDTLENFSYILKPQFIIKTASEDQFASW